MKKYEEVLSDTYCVYKYIYSYTLVNMVHITMYEYKLTACFLGEIFSKYRKFLGYIACTRSFLHEVMYTLVEN